MTNREWLESLTDEELAENICDDLLDYVFYASREFCDMSTCGHHKECYACTVRWLKMEH